MENTQLVQKIYDSFVKGDIPFILEQIDSSCEWNGLGENYVPYGGSYRGKQTSDFFKSLGDNFKVEKFDVHKVIDIGSNEVFAAGHFEGKSLSKDKSFASPWSMVWKIKDGKVVHFQNYFDTANIAASLN